MPTIVLFYEKSEKWFTYIYMNIVVDFNVEISVPQRKCGGKIYLSLAWQFKVTFNVVLFAIKQFFKLFIDKYFKTWDKFHKIYFYQP